MSCPYHVHARMIATRERTPKWIENESAVAVRTVLRCSVEGCPVVEFAAEEDAVRRCRYCGCSISEQASVTSNRCYKCANERRRKWVFRG